MKSFTPFIVIAICIGLYFLYISPQFSVVGDLNTQKAQYMDVLAKSKQLKDKRDLLLASYNSIAPEDIARLNKVIPDKVDPVLLATDLNTYALRYGVAFKGFKAMQANNDSRSGVVADPSGQPYRITSATFQITGPYPQFLQFVGDLQSSLRLIDIVSLSIKAVDNPKNPTDEQVNATFEINTYSLK